jgi:hypothetical protein
MLTLESATERRAADRRRALHNGESAALQMLDKALGDDADIISSALWTRTRRHRSPTKKGRPSAAFPSLMASSIIR